MLVDPYPHLHSLLLINIGSTPCTLLCTIFIRIPFLDSSYASLHTYAASELKLKWILPSPFLVWYPDKTVSTDWTLSNFLPFFS